MGEFSIHLKRKRSFLYGEANRVQRIGGHLMNHCWSFLRGFGSLGRFPGRNFVLFVSSQCWGTSITMCQAPPQSPPLFGHRGRAQFIRLYQLWMGTQVCIKLPFLCLLNLPAPGWSEGAVRKEGPGRAVW